MRFHFGKVILASLFTLGLVACPAAPDLTPDAFVIAAITNAAQGVDIPSAAFAVSGITAPVPISIIGGKYQIDSAPFTSVSGTVSAGQTVKVSLLSSVNFSTTKTATITVGDITVPFSVTTLAADTTPDAFAFPAVNNVALSVLTVSEPITVAGINTAAPISVSSGGEYSIDSTTNFVGNAGTIANGQVVRVRATSSSAFNTPVAVTLTIGGVAGTLTITTRQADTTPDAFSFTPKTNVGLNALLTSAAVITGIDSSTTISITGGRYLIDGGTITDQPGTISNNQVVTVLNTASSSFSTTTNATLTVGGVSATFAVTTRAKDETPNDFTFSNLTDVPINKELGSNTVVLNGFDGALISVVGGFYKINDGSFTDQPGTVSNGDFLTLRITSASIPLTNKDMLVTVGTLSRSWNVKTNNLLPVLPVETLPINIADGTGSGTNKVFGAPSIVRFNVPDTLGLKLDKIKVRVKIAHTFRSDLQVLLFAPNGFSTQLFDATTSNSADNIDVTFDGDSPNAFVTTCITNTAIGSCTGSVQPLGAFTNLNILNLDPKGQWRIEVRDGIAFDTGTIQILSLELTMKI